MMYAGRITLAIVLVAASVSALPNHLKAVVIDDAEPVPTGTSVSASFGGYSATAGLGGSSSGGGLFAAADSPLGSASAGLGGSSAGAGGLGASASTGAGGLGASASSGAVKPVTVGHKPVVYHQGQGLFDGIFNIPISVLQAVNTYLNNRGPVTKPYRRRHRPVVHKTVVPAQSGTDAAPEAAGPGPAEADIRTAAESGAHSAAGADTTAHSGQGPVVIQKRVNYDDIFNIPISALKSVNQLLNNGKK